MNALDYPNALYGSNICYQYGYVLLANATCQPLINKPEVSNRPSQPAGN